MTKFWGAEYLCVSAVTINYKRRDAETQSIENKLKISGIPLQRHSGRTA
jgi:hypothetical protein